MMILLDLAESIKALSLNAFSKIQKDNHKEQKVKIMEILRMEIDKVIAEVEDEISKLL